MRRGQPKKASTALTLGAVLAAPFLAVYVLFRALVGLIVQDRQGAAGELANQLEGQLPPGWTCAPDAVEGFVATGPGGRLRIWARDPFDLLPAVQAAHKALTKAIRSRQKP